MQCDTENVASDDKFRRRMGFLGLVGVAFTCAVYLMTLLRPVLEPFMWALFLVIAMRPLATLFECILLHIGRMLCGCGEGPGRSANARGCRLRNTSEEIELSTSPDGSLPIVGDAEGTGDLWRVTDSPDVESFCTGCCASVSRVLAVTSALAVFIGIMGGFATFIFEGVMRVQEDYAIYEKGAKNAVDNTKLFVAHVFGKMPRSVVDEISDNALSHAKAIASDLLSGLLSQTGNVLVQFLMLGLYVMFWLCTPMPLNTKTERIFRRYLFLKGTSCIFYGASVSVMLSVLRVELATVFGLMSFFFSFIPEVGAFIAMILPAPVILFDSRLEAPFLTLLTATSGQLGLKFLFANIIEVKLIENDATMKMHPVITLLAVTFFGFVWGPTGMLLSVPMMTYIKVVILSDLVPAAYRDPVLVLLEGDRRAPERHYRRAKSAPRLRAPD
mmetsp:Transcript_46334/g.93470  ORF Transcript_46334/g.93470 Transcript_46334/m.93470 type:complete len:443 (-) Transcript_46334:32-1360(-)